MRSLLLLLISVTCCAQEGRLFQVSTYGAFARGVFDGDYRIGDLTKHGNFGIGTFNGIDGEMVMYDGVMYTDRDHGKLSLVNPSTKTPFAIVVNFNPETSFSVNNTRNFIQTGKAISPYLRNKNIPYAVQITGTFTRLRPRVISKQTKPYRILAEVAREEYIYTLENVEATLVGFWFPDYLGELNVQGYHFHLITADKQYGGHITDAAIKEAVVSIQPIYDFEVVIPKTTDYAETNLEEKVELLPVLK